MERPTLTTSQQVTAALDTITLTGGDNYAIVIYDIDASFDVNESNASIEVRDEDDNVLYRTYFDNSFKKSFVKGLWSEKGKDVTIELSAGQGGVEGSLNVIYREEV